MAELSDRKQQNQAFLQELERQRLNKDCLRIIDLRGKVAGECLAYQFGNRTHYLDDRAYLLAKQLMSRFDGRYTVGVYEALFQALKQLDQSQQAEQDDRQPLPLIALDQPLQRAEAHIVFSTALELRLDDVLYHGYSIDLSLNAIRVSLKRTFSLQREDDVAVSFADLHQQYALPLLQDVRYQITKPEQDDTHTTVVMRRESQADDAFAKWFKQWQLDTVDVSADGLAIKLPADVPIMLNQRLQLDFNRWQTLTKKANLSAVPYQVKNIRLWEGERQLGLARIKNNCPESLNQFFDWVIKQNQDKLRADTNDVISTAESHLFGQAFCRPWTVCHCL